jgi:hypothetical protein
MWIGAIISPGSNLNVLTSECAEAQSQTIFENFAQALPRRLVVTYTRRNGVTALDGNTFRQPRIKTEAIGLRADERPPTGLERGFRIRARLARRGECFRISNPSVEPPHVARDAAHGGRNEMARKPLAIARNWAEHGKCALCGIQAVPRAKPACRPSACLARSRNARMSKRTPKTSA